MTKPITMWAGYVDEKIHSWETEDCHGCIKVWALYTNKRIARRAYQDTRKVQIVEVE